MKGVIRPTEEKFSVNKDFFKNASGQKNAKFIFLMIQGKMMKKYNSIFLVKINIR